MALKKYEIILSKVAPNKNKLWLTTEDNKPIIKKFGSKGWEPIGGNAKDIESLKASIDAITDMAPEELNSLKEIADSLTLINLDIKNLLDTKATKTEVNAKYTKPNTGIPKTDLASAVQTSLNKADTALQSHLDITHLATKELVENNEKVTAAALVDLENKVKSVYENNNSSNNDNCIFVKSKQFETTNNGDYILKYCPSILYSITREAFDGTIHCILTIDNIKYTVLMDNIFYIGSNECEISFKPNRINIISYNTDGDAIDIGNIFLESIIYDKDTDFEINININIIN